MTDPKYTHIVILTDRSGSMDPLAAEASGGINGLIADQVKADGRATLTFVQFDSVVETLHDFTPLEQVQQYALEPRGTTALLDAWGSTIVGVGERLAALPEDERPSSVQFVVVTDGAENASKEWTRDRVFAAVKEQTDRYGWVFTFLAANQDGVAVGGSYGVSSANSVTFAASPAGAQSAYRAASANMLRVRKGGQSGYTADERADAMGSGTTS